MDFSSSSSSRDCPSASSSEQQGGDSGQQQHYVLFLGALAFLLAQLVAGTALAWMCRRSRRSRKREREEEEESRDGDHGMVRTLEFAKKRNVQLFFLQTIFQNRTVLHKL